MDGLTASISHSGVVVNPGRYDRPGSGGPPNDAKHSGVVESQSFNRYTYVNNNPLRYTDPSGHVYQPPQIWGLYAGENRVVSPLLEFYGPTWDYSAATEPGRDTLFAWYDEHPHYDPAQDPVMQSPEQFGVNWFGATSDVASTYAEWHYWSQSEGSFWEKFWGDPTIVEGLAEMVLAMGAGAAKAAETLAWGRAYSGVQNVGNSNRYNADQTALIHLAQEAESRPRRGQGPLSANETNTLIEWAREYGLRVDADPSHLMDGHWRPRGKPIPHIHINRYHIPVPHNYTPR